MYRGVRRRRLWLTAGHRAYLASTKPGDILATAGWAFSLAMAGNRGRDFGSVRNYLRISLVNVHMRLVDRIDLAAVVADLRTSYLVPRP